MPCLLAKPIVDGLEGELGDRARVVRLSVFSDVGREVAARYGVRSVPTFLMFDANGTLLARKVGLPNRKEIEALIFER